MNLDGGKMRIPKHFLHGTTFVICILHPSGSTKYQCPSLSIEALWVRCSSCQDTCHHFTLAFICRCLTQLSSDANVCVTSSFHRCGSNKQHLSESQETDSGLFAVVILRSCAGGTAEHRVTFLAAPTIIQASTYTPLICQRHTTYPEPVTVKQKDKKETKYIFYLTPSM